MQKREPLKLILCLHNHQPEGNFRHVYDEGTAVAYLPFLEVVKNFRHLKINFHYSGSLLQYLKDYRPAFIKELSALCSKGRVEFLGGGFYEPILSIIPEEDALSQIDLSRKFIKKHLHQEIKGVWLTERIWEPQLPQILGKAGIEFTVVDDRHFTMVGMDKEKLDGFYNTEYNGFKIKVFGGSEKLRYLIPFRSIAELDKYLRQKYEEGTRVILYADDGEKFGMWPGTFKWVYEEKWLEKFFHYLTDNRDWINTCFFSEVLEKEHPSGFVYLKSASYREMLEWSGGFFRNFFIKYPEANFMHKRMFYVSKNIRHFESKKGVSRQARYFLYKAQANDAYWHGIFGGLYLNHLRHSVFSNLIKAENMLEGILEKNLCDIDYDGNEEVILKNDYYKMFLHVRGGFCCEWDLRKREMNLVNTLQRVKEPYHSIIFDRKKNGEEKENVQSIHDEKKIKDADIENFLIYDRYPKGSFVDFLFSRIDFNSYKKQQFGEKLYLPFYIYEVEEASRKKVHFVCKQFNFRMEKEIVLKNRIVEINYGFSYPKEYNGCFFGTEVNLSVFRKDLLDGQEFPGIESFLLEDEWFGLNILFKSSGKFNLFVVPVHTVSDSEEGIEKTYQHMSFLLWGILKPKITFTVEIV